MTSSETTGTAISAVGMVNGHAQADRERQPPQLRAQLDRRDALLGPGYQVFYSDPVEITHGRDVLLYAPNGDAYLDAYNNVASVGHAHPAVVEAVSRQLASVNTNTRYVQQGILDFSDQFLATFPTDLNRITYTCTGSEANDLAVRLAEYHTGNKGIIATANAYHGVTSAVASFSPSLGRGSPIGEHVRLIRPPDPQLAGGEEAVQEFLRQEVRRAAADLRAHGHGLAALIADPVFSSDGIFTHPAPSLGALCEEVRTAGGLFIADEVQAGFGRTGGHWWGFQRHGIVPDIVTVGKPMGNGYPVAAVILKDHVGHEFDRRVRYFNTFGGSTAAIAAAQAVLDVIGEQGLIANAHSVGAYLRRCLEEVVAECGSGSHVRGVGLFQGVAIVDPSEADQPDGLRARTIVNAMRQRRVLISASGPNGNVLKIRPPLTFQRSHVDQVADALSSALKTAH